MPNVLPDHIKHENRIVWLEAPEAHPYVREHLTLLATERTGLVHPPAGRSIGYSESSLDAEPWQSGRFMRRVFYVLDHDRSNQPDGTYKTTCPIEGVDPL